MKEEKPKCEVASNAVEFSYKGINTIGGNSCVGVRALYESTFPCISLAKYLKLLYILCVCACVC